MSEKMTRLQRLRFKLLNRLLVRHANTVMPHTFDSWWVNYGPGPLRIELEKGDPWRHEL